MQTLKVELQYLNQGLLLPSECNNPSKLFLPHLLSNTIFADRVFTPTNQTKLRWLCEEVRERVGREQRLRKQHQQTRDQLKALTRSRDSEHDALLQRLDQQEKLLHSLSTEKKGTQMVFN